VQRAAAIARTTTPTIAAVPHARTASGGTIQAAPQGAYVFIVFKVTNKLRVFIVFKVTNKLRPVTSKQPSATNKSVTKSLWGC
jgi:hypothetical protein